MQSCVSAFEKEKGMSRQPAQANSRHYRIDSAGVTVIHGKDGHLTLGAKEE